MKLITVEIGFSETKITDGEKEIKFPSVCSRPGVSLDLGKARRKNVYHFDGADYLVGDDTEHSLNIISLSTIESLIKYAPLFVMASRDIFRIKEGEKFSVATGLPLTHYSNHSKRGELAKSIKKGLPDVEHVYVIPQGVGILADVFDKVARGEVVVIDIGYNTIDIVVAYNGSPSPEKSDMLENQGISLILDELHKWASLYHGISLSPIELQRVFKTKKLKVHGEEHNISEAVEEMIQGYSETLASQLVRQLHTHLIRAEKIIIAGGGGYYLKDLREEKYNNRIIRPRQPEFSNARGFHIYAMKQMEKELAKTQKHGGNV